MVMFELDMDIANINKFQENYVSANKFTSILDEFLPTGQGYLDVGLCFACAFTFQALLQSFILQIPLDSAFGRFFGATINPLDGVSNIFALSIALSLIYLLLLAIHTVLLLALKIDVGSHRTNHLTLLIFAYSRSPIRSSSALPATGGSCAASSSSYFSSGLACGFVPTSDPNALLSSALAWSVICRISDYYPFPFQLLIIRSFLC
jgi:hypothetical protein